MIEPIESNGKLFRVVDILSPSRIVLNCGSNDNIERGSKFVIFAYGKEITDPDSGEVLERVYLPRGTGAVVVLQKRICTVESTRTAGGFQWLITGAGMEPPPIPFDGVHIGDSARLVTPRSGT
jgi:hypothetical protein